ncbi:hypothetical protein D9M69_595790 [compost metagenome]
MLADAIQQKVEIAQRIAGHLDLRRIHRRQVQAEDFRLARRFGDGLRIQHTDGGSVLGAEQGGRNRRLLRQRNVVRQRLVDRGNALIQV